MTDYFECAVRQVLGREPDEDDGDTRRRHGSALAAKVTLPRVYFLERPPPDWWNDFEAEMAQRKREASRAARRKPEAPL